MFRGEQEVWLRREANPVKHKSQRGERNPKAIKPHIGANDDPLWLALKAKRTELSREQGVPPYVIFHDSTLIEILNHKPKTLGDMSKISGVGAAKLEKYGDTFLEVVENVLNSAT